ncbi:uncharacterized protein BP5553_04778 [Venustampulla echinocandica]|uniref:F-box domain-containing protein n=1 Tax=Venustampulla echinocandica TaxID=2656787 RepID=A0A370TP98_9HELO|nr:uncharacterized protein BP5553_04778 [Venustampulla echinocandica]RDL37345.1 hypothetical protein BP5553_04778 [Venustampulla echinocandica]
MEKLENNCAPPNATATGLLRLPFEIRLQIYQHCIPQKRVISVSSPQFYIKWPCERSNHTVDLENTRISSDDGSNSEDDTLSSEGDVVNLEDCTLDFACRYWNRNKNTNTIFLLSKQISEEALDVLYGYNIFKLYLQGEGEYYVKKNFAEANRQRMRHLILIAGPSGSSCTPGKIPDDALWCSLLPQLTALRIVAEQPLEVRYSYIAPTLHYYIAPMPQQYVDCWIDWLRPFLQCFGQHLAIQTIVEIDVDGRPEIAALVKECLPPGYREIRCRPVGDFIFKRGWFSRATGYWDDEIALLIHAMLRVTGVQINCKLSSWLQTTDSTEKEVYMLRAL